MAQNRLLLNDDGTFCNIEDSLCIADYAQGKVSSHVSMAECSERTNEGTQQETGFVISRKLLSVFEDLRAMWGKPLQINSAWRSAKKQLNLNATNPNSALYSPHQEGLAFDIDCDNNPSVVDQLVNLLRDLSKKTPLRIGWLEYRNSGSNFVHFDVAPFYYGYSGVWNHKACPKQWREVNEW
jgi:hypothetical protein